MIITTRKKKQIKFEINNKIIYDQVSNKNAEFKQNILFKKLKSEYLQKIR